MIDASADLHGTYANRDTGIGEIREDKRVYKRVGIYEEIGIWEIRGNRNMGNKRGIGI